MNNALIIEQSNPSEPMTIDRLENDQELMVIVKALDFLKSNVHFKRYIAKVMIPELEKKRDMLATEKVHDEICRLQGDIRSIKRFMDIEHLEKNYKVRFQRTHGKTN